MSPSASPSPGINPIGDVDYPVAYYISEASSNVDYTLNINPQKVMTEEAHVNQEIFFADDGLTEHVIAYSSDKSFVFILQWNQLSDADAGTIWDCWLSHACGYMYSFKWEHPLDNHIYVVKFDSNIERLIYPGIKRGISEVRLRVLGYIS